MEATAAVLNTPHVSALAHRVNEYLRSNGIKISNLADEIPYSRPTLSRYLAGTYPSDATGIERALRKYLGEDQLDPASAGASATITHLLQSKSLLSKRSDFFESTDAKNVIGVCAACQEYRRMGLVTGNSGYGKTYSLKQFAKMPRVAYIRCNAIMGHRDLIREIERVVGIPKSYGSICERLGNITDFFNENPGYLLIVDEADKLLNKNTQTKMDSLRDLYDISSVGIVFAGEPRLKSLIACYLDRMENRIVYYAELEGLNEKELDHYLAGYEIEPAALQELRRRACTDKKSCFRLLDITLTNVFDLMEKTGANLITCDVIRQASSWMAL